MRTRTTVTLLPLVLAVGCNGVNEEDTINPSTSNLNTECAVASNFPRGMAAIGDNLVFLVNETEQSLTDLNGDGDAADDVVHMLNTATGVVTNLGISGIDNFASDGTTIAWIVAEEDENRTLNPTVDTDLSDHFMVIFDPAVAVSATNPRVVGAAGVTPPTGLNQSVSLQADDGFYAYVEHESLMGVDLNGDAVAFDMGILADSYVTVYNVEADTFYRTGAAANSTALAFALHNGVLAFTVSESEDAETDYNGDLDSDDVILFAHELGSGGNIAIGRAIHPLGFAIVGTPASPVIAYSIDESKEFPDGSVGLNTSGISHDFDAADFVLAVFNVGPNIETIPAGGIAIQPTRLSGSATRLAFAAVEEENGLVPADFNSDGDSMDIVPFWLDLASPFLPKNVGVAQDPDENSFYPVVCDDFMLMFASEEDQGAAGTNYNVVMGDTDVDDTVAFFVNIQSAASTAPVNLGIAGTQLICSDSTQPTWFFVTASENANAGTDLNKDGDTIDEVFAYFPVSAGGQVDTTIRVGRYGGTSSSVFVDFPNSVAVVNFAQEGTGLFSQDLNKDLDSNDVVATVQLINKANGIAGDEVFIGTVSTTAVAEEVGEDEEAPIDAPISIFPFIINGNTFAYPALESADYKGVDYNQDGDLNDSVLFCFTIDGN